MFDWCVRLFVKEEKADSNLTASKDSSGIMLVSVKQLHLDM